jgi:cytoskeleton protein RodZ
MADGFANGTPGQRLREAREARGADLQTAHEGTKIPIRLLEAIERDEYHKLSGPLYARSFLRNYAGWVGLDAEDILRGYESVVGRPDASGGDEMVWREDQVQVRRVGSTLRRDVLIGVAVVLLLALVAWGILALIKGDRVPAEAAPDEVSAVVAEPQPGPAQQAPAVADVPARGRAAQQPAAQTEAMAARLARLDADTLGPGQPVVAPGDPPVEALPAALPASAAVPFQAGTPSTLVLRVLLPAPTNCSVRCDDQQAARPVVWPDRPRPLPARDVKPGVAYAVRDGYAIYWGARDTFTLTLGDLRDAGASLNGADLPVDRWQTGQPVVLDQHTLQRLDG